MKNTVLLFTLTLALLSAKAQNPVSWTYTATKKSDKTYEVKLVATIGSGWHLYSQNTPDGGPLPTRVSFKNNPLTILDGGVKEAGKLEVKHEEVFDVDTKFYSNKVEFIQIVKKKAAAKTAINGDVEFMVCNDTQCLPPAKQSFTVYLN